MALTSPARPPRDPALGLHWRRLARQTVAVALAAATATTVLWQIDGCRARWCARRDAHVWGRPMAAWEARLDAPAARERDSAITALQVFVARGGLDAATRVRLARHLAQRFADTAAATRTLAVPAALDAAEPDADAMQALRVAAAALLHPGRGAPARFAALEVLARLGADSADAPLVARTALADSDADVRALAAAVRPHAVTQP